MNKLLLILIIILLLILNLLQINNFNYENLTLTPTLTFTLNPTLINLPLYKYPFIGAHDAITGSIDNNIETFNIGNKIHTVYQDLIIKINKSIPIIKTQSLSLLNLYKKGVRFFDLRIDLEKNFKSFLYKINNDNDLWFHHAAPLIKIDDCHYLQKLINIAILEKTVIILYFSHYTKNDEIDIINLINTYLKKNNFINNCTILNTDNNNNLQTKMIDFLNKNIYIICILNGKLKYVQDNFNKNISCFINNQKCIDNIPNSLEKSTDDLWKQLKKYMDTSNDKYKSHLNNINNDSSMYITQAFFQAPTHTLDILNLLFYTKLNNESVIKVNNDLDLNNKIVNYIIKNNLKSNVFLFDAIKDNNTILILKKYIENNIN